MNYKNINKFFVYAFTVLVSSFLTSCPYPILERSCEIIPLGTQEKAVIAEIIRINNLDTNINRIEINYNLGRCDSGFVETISIMGAGIDTIPPTIANLQRTTRFNFYNNKLRTLPIEMVNKFNNTHLDISYNKICQPHPELIAWANKADTTWRLTQNCP